MTRQIRPNLAGSFLLLVSGSLLAQSPWQSSEEFAKYAMKLRENALTAIEPRVSLPTTARTVGGAYKWKTGIVTTTFWVGEAATVNNPVHNHSSSWDLNWASSFGGYDNPDPAARIATGQDYRPRAFIPQLNPFYIALPYNDVTRGTTKPEAVTAIPWFRSAFVRPGQSVCRDRWVAVRNPRNGRIAYGQWSDCGPFRTDHWQYVFGNERPLPNLNGGAGLDVSPAIRDFLGMKGTDITDWRFVEVREVPPGPWRRYGSNNPFANGLRGTPAAQDYVKADPAPKKAAPTTEAVPRVTVK
jgi:hypothetical protein